MLHKDNEVARIESAGHYREVAMAGIGALKLAPKRSDGYIETIYRREYRMSAARRLFLVLLVNATCIVCDQATKLIAKRYLQPGAIFSFAGDMFRLQYAENTGAFLSLGSSLPESWRHITFTVLVGIFLAALLLYTIFSATLPPSQFFCLSLLCGGGLSNLIDRIVYDGRVVDFLNVGIGPLRTGIFNVADMAITAAAILLALDALRQPAEKRAAAKGSTSAAQRIDS